VEQRIGGAAILLVRDCKPAVRTDAKSIPRGMGSRDVQKELASRLRLIA